MVEMKLRRVYFLAFFSRKQSSRHIKIAARNTATFFFQECSQRPVRVASLLFTAKIFTKGMKMIDGQD